MTSAETPSAPPGRRARRVAETRDRIVRAAMELHTSVGPGNTTISAIAARAGVQRHTVYAHFPDETVLFRACRGLWALENPFPDVARWAAVADPAERLRVALRDLYGWYAATAADLRMVLDGAERVPGMVEALAEQRAQAEAMRDLLLRGRRVRGARRRRLAAVVAHALEFGTWSSLVGSGGLSDAEAVDLMAGLADAACA